MEATGYCIVQCNGALEALSVHGSLLEKSWILPIVVRKENLLLLDEFKYLGIFHE